MVLRARVRGVVLRKIPTGRTIRKRIITTSLTTTDETEAKEKVKAKAKAKAKAGLSARRRVKMGKILSRNVGRVT